MGLRGGSVQGPSDLLYGTLEHGYYGEISASEFITGNQLATQVGLTAGAAFNSDAGWLKFSLDYKTLFVAKRPFRHSITWNELNAVGAVFGTAQITINGKLYKVRLLKGVAVGNDISVLGDDIQPTWGSEWNRLMYHVSASPNNGTMTSEGISVGDWAQFSNLELNVTGSTGSRSHVQESVFGTGLAFFRSNNNITVVGYNGKNNGNLLYGWRPCLELVE